MSACSALLFLMLFFTWTSITVTPAEGLANFAPFFRKEYCPRLRINNGKVKLKGRGRIAKFVCNSGFQILGKRFATCVRGHWTNPSPICLMPGCEFGTAKNGYLKKLYNDAFVNVLCYPGYKLQGGAALFCNGTSWNTTWPSCVAKTDLPSLSCHFEYDNICGWTHGDQNEFKWTRHNFATPSGHVGTGPSHDHTLGEGGDGYYMYIEASNPRKENDTASLLSPVYAAKYSEDACFSFWYHMYGTTMGFLQLFVKPESMEVNEISPIFMKADDQGNKWIHGIIQVPTINENFQVEKRNFIFHSSPLLCWCR